MALKRTGRFGTNSLSFSLDCTNVHGGFFRCLRQILTHKDLLYIKSKEISRGFQGAVQIWRSCSNCWVISIWSEPVIRLKIGLTLRGNVYASLCYCMSWARNNGPPRMEFGYTWIKNQSPTLSGKEESRQLPWALKSGQGFANYGQSKSRSLKKSLDLNAICRMPVIRTSRLWTHISPHPW